MKRLKVRDLRETINRLVREGSVDLPKEMRVKPYHVFVWEPDLMSSWLHLAGPFSVDPSQVQVSSLPERYVHSWTMLGDPTGEDLAPMFREVGIDPEAVLAVNPWDDSTSLENLRFHDEAWIAVVKRIARDNNVIGGLSDDDVLMFGDSMLSEVMGDLPRFLDFIFTARGQQDSVEMTATSWSKGLEKKVSQEGED